MPLPRPAAERSLLAALLIAFLLAACAGQPATAPSASPDTASGSPSTNEGSPEAAAPTRLPGCAGLEVPANEGTAHVKDGETVSYESEPPTSGPHSPTAAEPGWYDAAVPAERLVHSLEHGFIVAYRSGLDAQQEAALRARYDALIEAGYGALIVVPTDSIRDPLTLTAWDRLVRCVRAEPDAFEAFVREHYAHAPEGTLACSFTGADAIPTCAEQSPAPTREPTPADEALLARIPEPLRAECRPTTAFAEGADAGWDCFRGHGFAYGYAGFPTEGARDSVFERIASSLGAMPGACTGEAPAIETYARADGSTGRLACSTDGTTRSYYWTIDGSRDLGIAVALDPETDLRAFWESAGPSVAP